MEMIFDILESSYRTKLNDAGTVAAGMNSGTIPPYCNMWGLLSVSNELFPDWIVAL